MEKLGVIEIAQNDFLIVLDLTLFVLFARYVWIKIFAGEQLAFKSVLHNPAVKIGWALMLTFGSRWLDHVAFVLWTYHMMGWARAIAVFSLALAVWSAACVVRVFAGTAWGPRAWIWILAASAAFSVLVVLLPALAGL